MPSTALAEIEAIFGGLPLVLQRMQEAGELELHWPTLREVLQHPEPLPREVMDALLAALALRCRLQYCFVMHSLALVASGADRVDIDELGLHLTVPTHVPDHARWSRIVRLTWLSTSAGMHAAVAAHALELACTPEEHAAIQRVIRADALLREHVERHELDIGEEPTLRQLPAELRALVPEFVEFHTRLRDSDDERPVCTACASCQKVRAREDGHWYPAAAVAAMLPANVLYSHGMCLACAQLYAS